jgi:hypothetical protein
VTDHLNTVESKSTGDFRGGSIMTGHYPKLAYLSVNHWESLTYIFAEYLGVVVKHIMRTSTHANGGWNMPFVILKD